MPQDDPSHEQSTAPLLHEEGVAEDDNKIAEQPLEQLGVEPTSPEPVQPSEATNSEIKMVETPPNTYVQSEAPADAPLQSGSKPKKFSKKLIITSFVLVNVVILASTVWLLAQPKKNQTSTKSDVQVSDTKSSNDASKNTDSIPEVAKTLHFSSSALKLEFDYPSSWRITSNPDNTYMSIQSGQFDLIQANGTQTKARAIITIYAKYPESSDDIGGSSVISATSEKLTYKNPTKVQRSQTNLTFTRAKGVDGPDNVTAMFISGDQSYTLGQLVSSKKYQTVNPFIIFKVNACDKLCSTADVIAPASMKVINELTVFATGKDIITSMRFSE